MKRTMMCLLAFALVFIFIIPIYAQTNNDLRNDNYPSNATIEKSVKDYLLKERYNSDTPAKNTFSILRLFKSKAFADAQNVDEERNKLREEWKELLGLDVFYPYFKAQEVEKFVQEKTKVKVFNMRGKAEFNKDSKEVKYMFRSKF